MIIIQQFCKNIYKFNEIMTIFLLLLSKCSMNWEINSGETGKIILIPGEKS